MMRGKCFYHFTHAWTKEDAVILNNSYYVTKTKDTCDSCQTGPIAAWGGLREWDKQIQKHCPTLGYHEQPLVGSL